MTPDEIAELVEEYLHHIEEHIRESIDKHVEEETIATVELDGQQPPFIRLSALYSPAPLKALKALKGKRFEEFCATVLRGLGGTCTVTGSPADGGVDFVAKHLRFVAGDLAIPSAARLTVIGQAKNVAKYISETELRKFVGGARRQLHEMRKAGSLAGNGPVALAFWTTSEFHQDAKEFGRALGLWYLGGSDLANYGSRKGLLVLPSTVPLPRPVPPPGVISQQMHPEGAATEVSPTAKPTLVDPGTVAPTGPARF